jgi:hypothetical protein
MKCAVILAAVQLLDAGLDVIALSDMLLGFLDIGRKPVRQSSIRPSVRS